MQFKTLLSFNHQYFGQNISTNAASKSKKLFEYLNNNIGQDIQVLVYAKGTNSLSTTQC